MTSHLTSDLDDVHTRTDCGKQFESNCGLAVHMARVHGVRRSAPSDAGRDGICSSCKRGFHTRLRLVHHLSYSSPQCLEWCMLHCEPQDREVLDREDAGQRRKDKREGRSFLATEMPFVLGSCLLLLFLSHLTIFSSCGQLHPAFPVYSPLLPSPCLFHRHTCRSQVKSSQVKSSQIKSSQVKSSQVKSSQVKSSQVNSSLKNSFIRRLFMRRTSVRYCRLFLLGAI